MVDRFWIENTVKEVLEHDTSVAICTTKHHFQGLFEDDTTNYNTHLAILTGQIIGMDFFRFEDVNPFN